MGKWRKNDNGSLRQEIIAAEVNEGDKLRLETEENNRYDPNAIKVLSPRGNQIGYLNREMALKIRPALISGTESIVTVIWVNGDKMLGVGVRIELIS